jgi:hypothetical protein
MVEMSKLSDNQKMSAYEVGKPYSMSKETEYDYHMVEDVLFGVYSNLWEEGDKFESDVWRVQLDTSMQASSAGTLIDQLNKLMAAVELLTIELGYQFDTWIDDNIVLFEKEAQP